MHAGAPMLSPNRDRRFHALWHHCGGSWASLEARVRDAPAATAKLDALAAFRARVAHDPVAAPDAPLAVGHLEDALAWLSAPARDGGVAMRVDPEMRALGVDVLLARLSEDAPRTPRRAMEELLRRGPCVVPGLLAWLRRRVRDDAAVWAIVVLGELRDARSVPRLATLLRARTPAIAAAAAEALGKIGAPAESALVTATASGTHEVRLHAYGALGLVHTRTAFDHLVAGLSGSSELADVIARALAQHDDVAALEPLATVARRAPHWLRAELASAMATLKTRPLPVPIECDWRLRYRRLPALAWQYPPAWTTVAAVAHRRRRARAIIGSATDLRLHIRLDPPSRRCSACWGTIWEPVGLPLCRHTGHAVLALQRAVVERWTAAGGTDAWRALDDCDAADVRLFRANRAATQAIEHAREINALRRATLYWLVAIGCEDRLQYGSTYIDVIARDLDTLYSGSAPAWRDPQATRDYPQNFS